MKIKHLRRDSIDPKRWDQCVLQYGQGMPYAYFAYLDLASDKNWEALVSEDYQFIFPLPFEQKLGLKFYVQPILCQQLGLIGPNSSPELLEKFIAALPKDYHAFHLKFNESNTSLPSSLSYGERTNYVLNAGISFEQLTQNFSKSLRKRIRRSGSEYQLVEFKSIEKIVQFYKNEMEVKLKLGPTPYLKIQKILGWLQEEKLGQGYAAINKNGDMDACLFVAASEQRMINLFGASNASGREHHAMHFILNGVIHIAADKNLAFDFEGSDIPGVKKFYESFGAVNRPYFQLNIEQLPLWYSTLKKIKGLWN